MDFKRNDSVTIQTFWKSVFEVFCQTPKTWLISICLLHIDVQPSTKSYQLQEGVEGAKQPLTRALSLCPRITLGSPPLSPIIGFMAGWHWQKCGFRFAFTVQTAQNLLRKIVKIVATRCQILWLKCTKFDFGWGSAPDPAGGAYSAPPDPLAAFGGHTSKRRGRGRGGKGWGEGRGWEVGRKGMGGA